MARVFLPIQYELLSQAGLIPSAGRWAYATSREIDAASADRHDGLEVAYMILTPWKPLRKVLKILKSSLSANQIAFSFALGLFAGLPPMGLHVIISITLALFVRCSFRAFLLSMGLFKLISLAV
ncbi:DUF2062 domain-containing protein, partial [Candidatus Bipolaricaulota bacterium]|nr:DUF2062 domain-containing protein [Candidatus Bipolaricaulota bacterium]